MTLKGMVGGMPGNRASASQVTGSRLTRWVRRLRSWLRPLASWAGKHPALCIVIGLNILLLAFAGYVRGVNHKQLATVEVAAGSENLAFLQSPQVIAEFVNKGLNVDATGFGSGTLANSLSPTGYDAFILSSPVFADETEDRLGQFTEYQPFTTPLMVSPGEGSSRCCAILGSLTAAGSLI